MKVLIASHSSGKIQEFKNLLSYFQIDFYTLKDFAEIPEPIECGETLMENALIKAKYYYEHFNIPVLADDTGLFIKGLNGEPGIHAARYSGAGDKANREKVLANLTSPDRSAYFETALVFYDGVNLLTSFGRMNGRITDKETGLEGFGYDSIFIMDGFDKTNGELGMEIKNQHSHRYKAIKNLYFKLMFYLNRTTVDEYLTKLCKEVYPAEEYLGYSKCGGGMSNDTYLVSLTNKKVVVRIPGNNAEIFVNRYSEKEALDKAKNHDYLLQYDYFDVETGVKISPYLEEKEKSNDPKKINQCLDAFHSLDHFSNDYGPFKRLRYYQRICDIYQIDLGDTYNDLIHKLFKYEQYLESRPLVSCHNDCQLSNYVEGNTYTLIDFEFTGNNDILFDYACFGNNDLNIGKHLYELKVERALTEEENHIIDLWYSLQALSWYLVALFKDETGLSQTLGLDFKAIALMFLNKAFAILN